MLIRLEGEVEYHMNRIKLLVLKYVDRYRMALQKDLLAMQYLAPLTKDYLPWSIAAMRPSSIVVVLNEIMLNNKSSIVEFGGGLSTIYIASLLRRLGGHVYTIEHDETWANKTMDLLMRQELASYVTMIHAPLSATSLSLSGSLWYNEDIIRTQLENIKIDLLIVDGPPADDKSDKYVRYPALPFVWNYLAEDHTIMLHDIIRAGEQEILSRWEREYKLNFERRYRDGFIGVGRSRKALTV